MPHIALTNGLPGIRGLMTERPDTAAPLNALADALLRGPSPLSRGERELMPGEPGYYEESGRRITAHGYAPII
ncbi:hypothetical protein [Streptomyces sp. BE308]|uniref:hypothetical protein n=1 Tax=Streptomyces sp. BE308 TaxID=3002529 RepID=UPI003FA71A58